MCDCTGKRGSDLFAGGQVRGELGKLAGELLERGAEVVAVCLVDHRPEL